jgi:hypothetical protein
MRPGPEDREDDEEVCSRCRGGERRRGGSLCALGTLASKDRRKKIHFTIGTPTAVRSSVWTLAVGGEEIYLATAQGGQFLKASFHKSGVCRIALHEHIE